MLKRFPIFHQLDIMDCGPTCLKMIAAYFGKDYSLETLRKKSFLSRDGTTLQNINDAAESIGFRTLPVKLTFEQLDEEARLPCILYWNESHYVVLPPQNYNRNNSRKKISIADPGFGLVRVSKATFLKCWLNSEGTGTALLLEPTSQFYQLLADGKHSKGLSLLKKYLMPYKKKYIPQLLMGMLLSSAVTLIFPFLTQILVDNGIAYRNKNFIALILLSQLILFLGATAIEVIRSWLLLHMNSRINIAIISDFLFKLMRLPMEFFETKRVGDITQRINDHEKIEQFLTTTTLSTIFSMITLIVFLFVLFIYSSLIAFVFMVGSFISILWILFFLKKRGELIYARFQGMSKNQNTLYEIITGMQEIKLGNNETLRRWNWEREQAKIFHLNVKSLTVEQSQSIGSTFFTQLKNIVISYIAAVEVVNGTMTLGAMLSLSYIIGQLNSPLEHLLTFIRSIQDAKKSLARLSEIHNKEDEEKETDIIPRTNAQFENGNIVIKNLSFSYGTPGSYPILDNITLKIPEGKITAFVGASGSGKTTLLKLLLKFYEPQSGKISIGGYALSNISAKWWRNQCGVVMQDGFIFSDTIETNISLEEHVDSDRLLHACKVANIDSFIMELPKGFKTKIGNTGNGLSAGQKQRILIARAVYKNPRYILLDEATSALDAKNEHVIIDNLDRFFENKTVIVIAHRLSTIKHADQIIVMDQGRIAEIGTHGTLSKVNGKYFDLIKNQLEISH